MSLILLAGFYHKIPKLQKRITLIIYHLLYIFDNLIKLKLKLKLKIKIRIIIKYQIF